MSGQGVVDDDAAACRRPLRAWSRYCCRIAAAPAPIGPAAANRAIPSSPSTVGSVTSRPTSTVGSVELNTACAASGSAQTLNSAAAVTLPPRAAEPPITTSRPIRAAASG